MAFQHRKSAALAIDGQPNTCRSGDQRSAIDRDDIDIWLQVYLRAHAQPNRVIRKTMNFDQIGLSCADRLTLLSAFEYRYSVVLGTPDTDCFANVRALGDFLLSQLRDGQKETTAYVGTRRMVRTLLSAR